VAVALVVVSHLSPLGSVWRLLGSSGVTVFFTLSGFLITSLLLEEYGQSGHLDLARFYLRRMRRLAPALVVMVVVVTAVLAALGHWDWMTVGALTYTANWMLAFGHGDGSPLGHTWSLAIEEQFYLVWPILLLLALRRGRSLLRRMLYLLCGVSFLVPLLLGPGDIARVYYGSDARAFAIVAGCLLAVLMSGRGEGRSRPVLAAVVVGAVVVVGRLPFGNFERLLAPQLVALLAAVALFASAQGIGVRWLELSWLRWLGLRSYGLYLWHFPLFVGLAHVASPVTVALVGLPAALMAAEVSWRYVEQPLLRRSAAPTLRREPAPGVALGRVSSSSQ
jgi:peptidoglycan/LPS O-acetylase OafA/YrhL